MTTTRPLPHPAIRQKDVRAYLEQVVGDDLHAKCVLSIANASLGAIQAASLSLSAIGQALAAAEGLNPKHAIKQVDRLLSNEGFDIWTVFGHWIGTLVGPRSEIVVAMDWTDFDGDDQSTLMLHLVTSHGRTTPLCWSTVQKSTLKGWRNVHEDTLLELFAQRLPAGLKVTVLADRGFGDVGLYELLDRLGLGYVIRFRGNIMVEDAQGTAKPAKDWVPAHGRACLLRGARVTRTRAEVPAVVCVKARAMKEPWCLAASDGTQSAAALIKQYGRRFTIEERFRDTKDPRYGLGLGAVHIRDCERRDRLLLIDAFAGALLTLLGAAGESLGMDRMLRANTVKHRTHSLITQGLWYFKALPAMKREKMEPLVIRFGELVAQQIVFRGAFGLL
jgi:hypothetical protein